MKRSVNFTGRKPMKASHVVSIGSWLGMSDAEMAVVFGKAPLFVNINGEDTVPARIEGTQVRWSVGRSTYVSTYKGTDIHKVEDDGEVWYEINDAALLNDK